MTRAALPPALAALVAALLLAGLWPLDFGRRNGVRWADPGPGLHLEAPAIAYTRAPLVTGRPAPTALSVELWIEEPPRTPNWGPRKIVSLFDGAVGAAASPFRLGSRGGLLFLDARGARSLRAEREFARGRWVFAAAVLGPEQAALYLDGLRMAARARRPAEAPAGLGGRLVLGSESNGMRAWIGTLRGLAVHGRALDARELREHDARVRAGGMRALLGEPGLLALYPLDEGAGDVARSPVPDAPALHLPRRFAPFAAAALRGDAAPGASRPVRDAGRNLAGFVPLGLVLGLLAIPSGVRRRAPRLAAAWLLGVSLSLAIEVAQHYLPSRTSSARDVVWNGGGTAAGLGLAVGLRRLPRRR